MKLESYTELQTKDSVFLGTIYFKKKNTLIPIEQNHKRVQPHNKCTKEENRNWKKLKIQ